MLPMTVFAVLPLYGMAWLVAKASLKDPVLSAKTESAEKYWQIDGLRFFLAFSVFVHHAFIIRDYVARGVWRLTDDRFVTFLGQAGVSLFFIITAFLFWDKALRKPDGFNAVAFFAGRFRRLAPAYLVAALPFILISLAKLPDLNWNLIRELLQTLGFGFFGAVNLGSLSLSPAYIGVFWTLFYEWKFYLFLPVLYVLLQIRSGQAISTALCVITLILSSLADTGLSKDWPYISLFAAGILAANLHHAALFREYRVNQNLAAAGLVLLIVFNLMSSETYYGTNRPILFLAVFLLVLKIEKPSFVGRVLASRPTLLLGNASYSMYVIHGLIISALAVPFTFNSNLMSTPVFVFFCMVSTVAVALLSVATYKYVELPYAFRKSSPSPLTTGATP